MANYYYFISSLPYLRPGMEPPLSSAEFLERSRDHLSKREWAILAALGLEPRGNLKYQGDPNPPQGDSVLIYVEWESNGKKVKVRGEDLVYNVKEKRPMKRTPWVFTGSKIYKGRFMAEIDESLITTYHDPYTIIDNPLPEGGDDTIYCVNEKVVPPKGTKILMTIKPFR